MEPTEHFGIYFGYIRRLFQSWVSPFKYFFCPILYSRLCVSIVACRWCSRSMFLVDRPLTCHYFVPLLFVLCICPGLFLHSVEEIPCDTLVRLHWLKVSFTELFWAAFGSALCCHFSLDCRRLALVLFCCAAAFHMC